MAGTQHTQTHPKFIYTFLAVHRDCIADGKNTVHVAADKHAARESECISHYLAFVQLKADQALDKAGKIIMADVQEVHHA